MGVAPEAARVLLELGLVGGAVRDEHGALRVPLRQLVGDVQPARREHDALRGRAGGLGVLHVAEAVALEHRDGEPDLPEVLDRDRLGRLDRPVEDRLDLRRLHLGHLGGEVGGRLVVDVVRHDLDAVLRGELLDLLLARLAEAGVAGQEADAGDLHLLHLLEDLDHRVAVLLRGLEHVRRHGLHDHLGGREGEQDRLALLDDALDRHGLAARGRADDGEDLLLLHELLRERDRLLGARARVLHDELDLPPAEAAAGVGRVHHHLQRVGLRRAEERGRAGHGQDGADLDRLLRGEREGGGERRREQGERSERRLRHGCLHGRRLRFTSSRNGRAP